MIAQATAFGLAALVVVLLARWLLERYPVPFTVLLTVIGGVYAFLPGPNVRLRPELVLSLVIPPLLYNAALEASLLDIRRYRRPIISLSVGLVLVTALPSAGCCTPPSAGSGSPPRSRWVPRSHRPIRSRHCPSDAGSGCPHA